MQSIELVNLDNIAEARRQIEICNACRYCESYCAVFPAIHSKREFSDSDLQQFANLCHNCRGCFYACQYTAPHEFALNVPEALAKVRQDSWQAHTKPAFLSKIFHQQGLLISLAIMASIVLFIWVSMSAVDTGTGFYSLIPHETLVSIFLPSFLIPLVLISMSIRSYWRSIGGTKIRLMHIAGAFGSVIKMKNLSGGHGEGCNFENEDEFTNTRRFMHQATMYGFLLCFAATSVATIMHYGFNLSAPYGFFSLPKLLGIPGGILLSIGTIGLAKLKLNSDRKLGDQRVWGGEMAFILMLFLASTSGLALYVFGNTPLLASLLAIHLGSVFCFFLLMPYSKMVHGFYRLASLIRDEQRKSQ